MVSSITQDPYSIIISLNLASSVNLNIGAPPRPTELPAHIHDYMSFMCTQVINNKPLPKP